MTTVQRWLTSKAAPYVVVGLGLELLLAAVLFGYFSLRQEREQLERERTHTQTIERENLRTSELLRERLRSFGVEDELAAEVVERFLTEVRQGSVVVRAWPTPRPTPQPSTIPRPTQPPNVGPQAPSPTEPGGDDGSLKPFLCAQGLAPALGVDCSPESGMASAQIMCNLGLDAVLALDCGKDDMDGPDS